MAKIRMIGRFQVGEQLGEGNFGIVYQAYDPKMKREVALKVLRMKASSSVELVRRFKREFELSTKLQHPNIVRVYAAGNTGSTFYIASQLIRGQTLADLILLEEGLEPWRAAYLTVQLADALSHAHQHRIIHRDVKPGNIMVDDQDNLFLMDFGLATLVDQSLSQLTMPGTQMGTPAYMSPEQAMAGLVEDVAELSDVYSAGATFYSMLTGKLPFAGPKEVVIPLVINTPPKPPRKYRPDLDPKLESICLTAMAKKPRDRYRNSQELAVRLREWLTALPVRPKPVSSRQLSPPQDEDFSDPSGTDYTTQGQPDDSNETPSATRASENTQVRAWNPFGILVLILGLLLVAGTLLVWSGRLSSSQHSLEPGRKGIQEINEMNRPKD